MLDRANLLDLIRTFTLFSTNDKGQTVKMVGRYQQFRAVKLAVKRLLEGTSPRERSGIIWHTQGSGKSLTMMFMVREMYRHARLSNWKVVFVTYVIVHELAHLIEANHTPRFWNIVRVQVPTVEKARSWLSENGQVLEEEI
jgi:rRNA processing protein Krr1/Pno1